MIDNPRYDQTRAYVPHPIIHDRKEHKHLRLAEVCELLNLYEISKEAEDVDDYKSQLVKYLDLEHKSQLIKYLGLEVEFIHELLQYTEMDLPDTLVEMGESDLQLIKVGAKLIERSGILQQRIYSLKNNLQHLPDKEEVE